MRLVRGPEDAPPAKPPEVVATIGNFDGVHRGHRRLIGKVLERAAELGVQSAVITFDPHPRLVLRPHIPLALLSSVEEKAELLSELGIDHTLVWRFDTAIRHTSAEAFLEQLNRYVRVRLLLHGPGFAIGWKRQGTASVLAEIGGWLGFDVEEVAPYRVAESVRTEKPAVSETIAGGERLRGERLRGERLRGERVSSTAVRALIQAGRIQQAARMLGHSPSLTGVVVEGERVGRTLGVPTANLEYSRLLAVPADGVYAAWAELEPLTPGSRRHPAAVSIGSRPTFDGEKRVVEAHFIDFTDNLYGQVVRLHFVARLRGQERYHSVDALIAQMHRDVATARAILIDDDGADQIALHAADG